MGKESKVKNGNYYVVQSFMVKEFGLKGLEKDIYAIIYGFSQAEQSFKGSLQYLADWTNSTKQGILKALNSLIEKKLIEKKENSFNGVKFVEYYTTEFNGGIELSLMGIQQSLPNNIDDNIKNNIDNNSIVVLNYLNEKAKTKYRPVECHLRFINARLKDYSVDDIKKIIDRKCKEWLGDDKMRMYLRPKTLFNQTNFENYINEPEEIQYTSTQSRIELDKQVSQQESEDFLAKLRDKEWGL